VSLIHDCVQGTTVWMKLRAGIPCSSEFDKIITPKGEPSAASHKYMCRLLGERIIGAPIEGFVSQWMERGSEMEHKAVEAWEFIGDVTTFRVGFVTTDDGQIGASPDRFITERPNEELEVKCPSPAIHMEYLLAQAGAGLDKAYKIQTQGQLWVCEKEINTAISFHPDLPMAQVRMERDEAFIEKLGKAVREFAERIDFCYQSLVASGIVQEKIASTEDGPGAFGITDDDIAALVADRFPQHA
jgi:hypothetical protein